MKGAGVRGTGSVPAVAESEPTGTKSEADGLMALTDRQRWRYERDGALFPVPVLEPSGLAEARAGLASLEARLESLSGYLPHPGLFFPWAHRAACGHRVVGAAVSILGPEVLVHSTLILSKAPHDSKRVAWHQDGTVSGWYRFPSVTAWIALEDSNADNGCMRILPGTHRGGRLPHRPALEGDNLFGKSDEIADPIDENSARDVVLTSGEMSLHHPSVVHGSRPNGSEHRRVGLIVRFITPAYRFDGEAHPVLRVQGTGPCPHMTVWEAPRNGDGTSREIEDPFTAWKSFVDRSRVGKLHPKLGGRP